MEKIFPIKPCLNPLDLTALWNSEDSHFPDCLYYTLGFFVSCSYLFSQIGFAIYFLVLWQKFKEIKVIRPISSIQWIIHGTLLVCILKDLVSAFWNNQPIDPIFIWYYSVLLICLIISLLVCRIERALWYTIYAAQYVFWFSIFFVAQLPFFELCKNYTKLSLYTLQGEQLGILVSYFLFGLELVYLSQTDYSSTMKKIDEESHASVLSAVAFQWLNKVIYKVKGGDLDAIDCFDMHEEERSEKSYNYFIKFWKDEIQRTNEYNKSIISSSNSSNSTPVDDQHAPLQDQVPSHPSDEVSSPDDLQDSENPPLDQDNVCDKTLLVEMAEKGGRKPSLLKALMRAYGGILLQSWFYRFIYDFITFINPFMLSKLLRYTEDLTEPHWHGNVYCMGFVFIGLAAAVCCNQSTLLWTKMALRIKGALVATIYRKALLVNVNSKGKSVGSLSNLISVDAEGVSEAMPFIWILVSSVAQISLTIFLLYLEMGPSVFSTIGFMALLILFNVIVISFTHKFENKELVFKDARVNLISEILHGIRMVKLYAWERYFETKAEALRINELECTRKVSFSHAITVVLWDMAPYFFTFATFLLYVNTGPESRILSPEKAFFALSLFNTIRICMSILPLGTSSIINATIGMERIEKFLLENEIDTTLVQRLPYKKKDTCPAIEIRDSIFSFKREGPPILHDITMCVPRGKLYALVGKSGTGKTALLGGILGENYRCKGSVTIRGTVSYMPQHSWLENLSVRDNILFGKKMCQERYNAVIQACALEPDLESFSDGDLTSVGERGANLSGGQKQRVAMARAVYQEADIYLLDNALSALDATVGRHIFDAVVGPCGLLKDKTRLVITHSIQWLPVSDRILVLDKSGRIREQGTYKDLLASNSTFANFLRSMLPRSPKFRSSTPAPPLSSSSSDSDSEMYKTHRLKTSSSSSSDLFSYLSECSDEHADEPPEAKLITKATEGKMKKKTPKSKLNSTSCNDSPQPRVTRCSAVKENVNKTVADEVKTPKAKASSLRGTTAKKAERIPKRKTSKCRSDSTSRSRSASRSKSVSSKGSRKKSPSRNLSVKLRKPRGYKKDKSLADRSNCPLSDNDCQTPVSACKSQENTTTPLQQNKENTPTTCENLRWRCTTGEAVDSSDKNTQVATESGQKKRRGRKPKIDKCSVKATPNQKSSRSQSKENKSKSTERCKSKENKSKSTERCKSKENKSKSTERCKSQEKRISVKKKRGCRTDASMNNSTLHGKGSRPIQENQNHLISYYTGRRPTALDVIETFSALKLQPVYPKRRHSASRYAPEDDPDDESTASNGLGWIFPPLPAYYPGYKRKTILPRQPADSSAYESSLTSLETNQSNKADNTSQESFGEGNGVSFSTYKRYVQARGYLLTTITLIGLFLYCTCQMFSSVWLQWYVEDPIMSSRSPAVRLSTSNFYLSIFGLAGVAQFFFLLIFAFSLVLSNILSSKNLHKSMLASILRAPMYFYDKSPVGRMVNRFAKDMETLDHALAHALLDLVFCFGIVVTCFIMISYSTPAFVFAILPMGTVYYYLLSTYMPISRHARRLESVTISPIFSHFSSTLAGLAVIRSFGQESRFHKTSDSLVNKNARYYFLKCCANHWLTFRLEVLATIIVLAATLLAVSERAVLSAGIVGLSLTYALQVSESLDWLVQKYADLETNAVALERIYEYTDIEQESNWDDIHSEKRLSKSWPSKGRIEFRAYSTRYRPDLDLVLNQLELDICAGQKLGVAGRSGAGKSSLMMALFRLIEPSEGSILVDGIDINSLGLHQIRSRFCVLPQHPIVFTGTLRENLDPFSVYSDAQIWHALEQCRLTKWARHFQKGLHQRILPSSMSIGQRQLIGLARTLLQKSRVILLDEITADIDLSTGQMIMETIKNHFSQSTIIIIAHKLSTILDVDRLLILDRGKVAEFGKPQCLLANKKSLLSKMMKDSY